MVIGPGGVLINMDSASRSTSTLDLYQLRFRELEASDLHALVGKTAGAQVQVLTDLEKDRPEVVKVLKARGSFSPEAQAAEDAVHQLTTYAPTEPVSSGPNGICTIVFPTKLNPESEAAKNEAISNIYRDSEKGEQYKKFAAYHEGAHCVVGELLMDLKISKPTTLFAQKFVRSLKEGFSEVFAGFYFLRDAVHAGPVAYQEAKLFLTEIKSMRDNGGNVEYKLAGGLLGEVINIPAIDISSMTDEELRVASMNLVKNNARAYWDWLLSQPQ
jgi:hypothetical protein